MKIRHIDHRGSELKIKDWILSSVVHMEFIPCHALAYCKCTLFSDGWKANRQMHENYWFCDHFSVFSSFVATPQHFCFAAINIWAHASQSNCNYESSRDNEKHCNEDTTVESSHSYISNGTSKRNRTQSHDSNGNKACENDVFFVIALGMVSGNGKKEKWRKWSESRDEDRRANKRIFEKYCFLCAHESISGGFSFAHHNLNECIIFRLFLCVSLHFFIFLLYFCFIFCLFFSLNCFWRKEKMWKREESAANKRILAELNWWRQKEKCFLFLHANAISGEEKKRKKWNKIAKSNFHRIWRHRWRIIFMSNEAKENGKNIGTSCWTFVHLLFIFLSIFFVIFAIEFRRPLSPYIQ